MSLLQSEVIPASGISLTILTTESVPARGDLVLPVNMTGVNALSADCIHRLSPVKAPASRSNNKVITATEPSGAPQGVAVAPGGVRPGRTTGLTATEAVSVADGPVRTLATGADPRGSAEVPSSTNSSVQDSTSSEEESTPSETAISRPRLRREARNLSLHGTVLTTRFPPSQIFRCVVEGCRSEFQCSDWTASKKSLEHHLARVHNITITNKNVCRFCGEVLDFRPSTQVTKEAVQPPSPPSNTTCHRCETCGRSFRSAKGFTNHLRFHIQENLRAARQLPLPRPRTCQAIRRRRGSSISEEEDGNTTTPRLQPDDSSSGDEPGEVITVVADVHPCPRTVAGAHDPHRAVRPRVSPPRY